MKLIKKIHGISKGVLSFLMQKGMLKITYGIINAIASCNYTIINILISTERPEVIIVVYDPIAASCNINYSAHLNNGVLQIGYILENNRCE